LETGFPFGKTLAAVGASPLGWCLSMPAWGWSAMDCTNTVPLVGGGFGLGNCAARKKRGRQSAHDAEATGDPLQHAKRFHKAQEV
jgi:hypothetical protein